MIPRICAYAQAAIVCSAIGACGGKVPARSATVLESPHAVEVPTGAETISLLGDTLVAPEQPPDVRAVYLARYREAEEALSQAPDDVEAPIWMGRRTAYLGRYRGAIDIYTHAMTLHPDDARLYRHRGTAT